MRRKASKKGDVSDGKELASEQALRNTRVSAWLPVGLTAGAGLMGMNPSIAIAGVTISTLLSAWQVRDQARMQKLFEELELLLGERLKSFTESPEGTEKLSAVVRSTLISSQEEKILLFALLLAGSLEPDASQLFYDRLKLIEELSVIEFEVLRRTQEIEAEVEAEFPNESSDDPNEYHVAHCAEISSKRIREEMWKFGLPSDEFDGFMTRLTRTGLMIVIKGTSHANCFVTTPNLKSLMAALEERTMNSGNGQ